MGFCMIARAVTIYIIVARKQKHQVILVALVEVLAVQKLFFNCLIKLIARLYTEFCEFTIITGF